ncbi:MAG: hypothetical protein HY301_18125 [Verrucomicrobia bacterium]|nr:hypothetical protein [Verrucomicrobiota bacterium]
MKSNSTAVIVPAPSATNGATAVQDLRPNKPNVEIPDPWVWLWVLLALLAAGAAAAFLLRRRKEQIANPQPLPVIPPAVRARNRLKAAFALIEHPDPFCTEVSAALREYLEERFALHAPERTTEEFLNELRASDTLDPEQKNGLGNFLESCDLAKFAKHRPGQTELMALHNGALRLVNETEPPAAPAHALAPESLPSLPVAR